MRRRTDVRRDVPEPPAELLRFDPSEWSQAPLAVVRSSAEAWEGGRVALSEWWIAEAAVPESVKGHRRAFHRWCEARSAWAAEHGGWPTGDAVTMLEEERDERRRAEVPR